MEEIVSMLAHLNITSVNNGSGASSDNWQWVEEEEEEEEEEGVPGVELDSHNQKYFYFHHSSGKVSNANPMLE
jgi:hypothetical protein